MKSKSQYKYQVNDIYKDLEQKHKKGVHRDEGTVIEVVIYKNDNLKSLIPYILVNIESQGMDWFDDWSLFTERMVDSFPSKSYH